MALTIARCVPLLTVSILALVILSAAAAVPAQGGRLPQSPARAGNPSPSTGPPGFNCTSHGWSLQIGPSGSNISHLPQFGPVPVSVPFTITLDDGVGTWNYSFEYFDGTWGNGTLVDNSTGIVNFVVNHTYTLPGYYPLSFSISCYGGGGGGGEYFGTALQIYGAAGTNPATISTNVTNGTVPLPVQYTAVVNGAPTGAVYDWYMGTSSGYSNTIINGSATQNVTLEAPGTAFAYLGVFYPNSQIEYAQAQAPQVTVNPQVWVAIAHTNVTNMSHGNMTFWANVTNLTGASYSGPGTFAWQFSTPGNLSFPVNWSGPRTGAEVNETYTVRNGSGLNFDLVTASFLAPGNVTTLGSNTTYLILGNNNPPPPPPPAMTINATPSSGRAPFHTNFTITSVYSWPANLTNFTDPFNLTLCAFAIGNSTAPCSALNQTQPWYGPTAVISATFSSAGFYQVVATISGSTRFNGTAVLALANTTIYVAGSGPSSSPLALTATGAPANGSSPLATWIGVQATGGIAPYNLSVCVIGPTSSAGGSGTCVSAASLTSWNGSTSSIPLTLNQSGYYTAVATVTDSAGNWTNASAAYQVLPAAPVAPLQVSATGQRGTGAAGTYDFVATISGGAAPYTVQWAFGDGSYGSSAAGGTVDHTYAASGTYTATLTVTDARGTVRQSSVGPLIVSLPGSAGASPLESPATVGIVVASLVVIVASAGVLVYLGRTVAERRRTQAWLDSVSSPPPTGPSPPSKPGP